ncbi:MAG TPA: acetyl-CoA C-acetyltransferase [Clostridia bacterium]|nr:acetyl-CoA C-acetyltransferase [Clostridia bacterium]
MRDVCIVGGARTAIGNFGGSLRNFKTVDLGSHVLREVLKRANLRPKVSDGVKGLGPEALKDQGIIELEKENQKWDENAQEAHIDEVIMGNVLQGGQGQNVARQAMVRAGIPKETSAFTINKVCASGLKSITLGAQSIMTGQAELIVAGGMECMSAAPYILPKARWGYRMDVTSRGEMLDLMVFDGLYEIFYDYHMGVTAENIAEKYGISRQEQDELALLSHQRARKAIKDGIFKDEIIPVMVPQRRKDPIVFDTDERPMDTSLEKMARLPAVFKKGGTVTAGNASGINDCAAAVILASEEKAKELGMKPLVKIRAFASGGLDPAYMGLGPIPAVKRALQLAGCTIDDIDVVELNEAFASQSIACLRELDMDMDKVNPLGSGISLGHPIGCTGTRVTVTLMNEMKRRNLQLGMATMCIGGGQGMAMIVENI